MSVKVTGGKWSEAGWEGHKRFCHLSVGGAAGRGWKNIWCDWGGGGGVADVNTWVT